MGVGTLLAYWLEKYSMGLFLGFGALNLLTTYKMIECVSFNSICEYRGDLIIDY